MSEDRTTVLVLGLIGLISLLLLALMLFGRRSASLARIRRILLGAFAVLIGAGGLLSLVVNPAEPPGHNGVVFALIMCLFFLIGGGRYFWSGLAAPSSAQSPKVPSKFKSWWLRNLSVEPIGNTYSSAGSTTPIYSPIGKLMRFCAEHGGVFAGIGCLLAVVAFALSFCNKAP